MTVLTTDRLTLRELTLDDAPFAFELVTDPDWLRFIGDKGVRTLDDARRYLVQGPIAMVEQHGHGLWMVETRAEGEPVGICGLIRRPAFEDVDVGFALLPAHRGKGYATEATVGALDHGRNVFGWTRILGLTSPENHASARVLEKAGLWFEGRATLPDGDAPLHLFAWDASRPSMELRPEPARPSVFTIVCGGEVAGRVAGVERDGLLEVTVRVDAAYAGRGVATAALGSFLHRDGTRPLHARVAVDGAAALRVLEKCGFEATGRARGEEVDELLLTLSLDRST